MDVLVLFLLAYTKENGRKQHENCKDSLLSNMNVFIKNGQTMHAWAIADVTYTYGFWQFANVFSANE